MASPSEAGDLRYAWRVCTVALHKWKALLVGRWSVGGGKRPTAWHGCWRTPVVERLTAAMLANQDPAVRRIPRLHLQSAAPRPCMTDNTCLRLQHKCAAPFVLLCMLHLDTSHTSKRLACWGKDRLCESVPQAGQDVTARQQVMCCGLASQRTPRPS